MKTFHYKARNQSGELIEDKLNADSQHQAIEELTKKGFYILSLHAAEEAAGAFLIRRKPKIKDVAWFTVRLSELVSSGVPILRALGLLENQFANKPLGKIIADLVLRIRDGASFSESIDSLGVFPPILSALVAAGEAGGNIDSVLNEAANIFDKELDLKNKVKSAMFYPALVFTMGILTVFFLLSFVIPKISGIFQDLGQALPLITRIVVAISGIFAKFWWLFAILGIAEYVVFKKYTKSGEGKLLWDEFKLKIPIISKIWIQREIILFSRSLGLLVKSGVSLVEALDLTKSVVSISRYKVGIEKLKIDLKEGASLSYGIRDFLPPDVAGMISVGEESGNLDNALLNIARNYEKELDYNLKVTTQLIEPLMILFVGCIVGVIIIAVLLPIFQLNMIIK
ncbi:MAG: type II secretion system F family protein [Candidatus Kaelpia aquatica]|nr:type II secretion system F family protein [Candidatus Kaelpia aquatica]